MLFAKQVSTFAVIGIMATAIHLCSSWLIVLVFPLINATLANLVGYTIAVPFGYIGHSKYTFKKNLSLRRFFTFFFNNKIVLITSLAVSAVLDHYDANKYLNIFLAVMIFPAMSFLLHKFMTFK